MKKISVILAVLMLVSTLALSAFAAGNATFTVGSAACKPGDTVTVPVVLKNSPGIVGAQLDLTFDPNVFSVTSYTTKDNRFVYAPYNAETLAGASKVTLVMANVSLNKIDGDIAIADVSFKIADKAADGMYEIAIANASAYTVNAAATGDAKQEFPFVDVTAGKAVIAGKVAVVQQVSRQPDGAEVPGKPHLRRSVHGCDRGQVVLFLRQDRI